MRGLLVHRASRAALPAILLLAVGCTPSSRSGAPEQTLDADLGPTIGSIAQVVTPAPVPVEGFGLVGNLPGTGSATCPPQVRAYLRRYILAQMPERAINVDELINSNTTAVVLLEGTIPALASAGDHFDVHVSLIPGSETTSLRGGWLYGAELRPQGPGGTATRPVATVEGPTFVNLLGVAEPDLTQAYVLGGGRTSDNYSAVMALPQADYTQANAVRNRLSERYGPRVLTRVSPQVIEYAAPPEYSDRKMRFVAMVAATFMDETVELTQRRIDRFVGRLASLENAESSEIALEAIGRRCLERLAPLLEAESAETRLRAARVMLSLRDDRALGTLRRMALDPEAPFRLEAIDAIATLARRNDAVATLRFLLPDGDMRVVQSAYEHLRRLGDTAVARDFVGRSFYLEHVAQADRPAIFVSRQGDPRIVIFTRTLLCRDDVFIESPGRTVVVSARPGQGYMLLSRQDPTGPGMTEPKRTGLVLSEIIRALGAEAAPTGEGQASGLEVSYSEIIAVLERMCASGAVAAEFQAGPLPEFD